MSPNVETFFIVSTWVGIWMLNIRILRDLAQIQHMQRITMRELGIDESEYLFNRKKKKVE